MDEIINSIAPFVSAKYLPYLVLLPMIGRGYDALKNGGGLRGVWRSIWLGRSVEKPKEQEENKPITTPKP